MKINKVRKIKSCNFWNWMSRNTRIRNINIFVKKSISIFKKIKFYYVKFPFHYWNDFTQFNFNFRFFFKSRRKQIGHAHTDKSRQVRTDMFDSWSYKEPRPPSGQDIADKVNFVTSFCFVVVTKVVTKSKVEDDQPEVDSLL